MIIERDGEGEIGEGEGRIGEKVRERRESERLERH